MFSALDHIAILVDNTDEALTFYRDRLGLRVTATETFDETGLRLTHLDLGNLDLQLVEPLTPDHPLRAALEKNGESLHHLCWRVPDMASARDIVKSHGLRLRDSTPHRGVQGKSALFLDPADTRGVLWEMTTPPGGDAPD